MAQKKPRFRAAQGPSKSPHSPKRGQHKMPEKIYSFHEADDRLFDIFRNHGFSSYPHEKRHQLVNFYQILMRQQKKENFTRLTKFRDVAIKHFIDCLMVDQLVNLQFPLLDVGTGPGFPGIPLKIQHPNERIVLAEGVRKRVDFLKKARTELELTELDIIGRNIDDSFELPMQTVITRAVAEVNATLLAVKSCIVPGGRMIFMKGPNVDPEVKRAERELKHLFHLESDVEYTLPNTPHKRRLVVFKRQAST